MLNTTVLNDLLSASHQNGFSVACLSVPIDNIHSYANYPAILDIEYCAYVYDFSRLTACYRAVQKQDGKIHIDSYRVGSGNGWADFWFSYHMRSLLDATPTMNWKWHNYDTLEQEIKKNLAEQPLAWAIHWQYHEEAPQHYDLGITDYTVQYDDDYLFVLAGGRKVFMLERLGLVYVGFRPMGVE